MSDTKKSGSRPSPKKKSPASSGKTKSSRRARRARPGPAKAFQQRNPSELKEQKLTVRGSSGHLTGEDLVLTLGSSGTEIKAGDVLADIVLNPELMNLPRLTSMSKLFRRWRLRSMSFEYRPTATIQPGQLLGYVDYDPYTDAKEGTNLQRLQRATASYGEKPVNITNSRTWNVMPFTTPLQIHWDSETTPSNWYVHGRFIIYANSTIAINVDCGNIVCKYDIEFLYPSYEIPAAAAVAYSPPGLMMTAMWDGPISQYTNVSYKGCTQDLRSHLSMNAEDILIQNLPVLADPSANTYCIWMLVGAMNTAVFPSAYDPIGMTDVYTPKRGEYSTANSYSQQLTIRKLTDEKNSIHLKPNSTTGVWPVVLILSRIADFTVVPRESKESKEVVESKTTVQGLEKVLLTGTIAPPNSPMASSSSSSSSTTGVTSSSLGKGWF